MKKSFKISTAQSVESWVFWGIAGRWACIAGALLYWFGLIEITPYSLVSGLFASAFSESYTDIQPLAWEFVDWFLGGVFWLFVAVLWIEFVRFLVAVIEAGSTDAYRQQRREDA